MFVLRREDQVKSFRDCAIFDTCFIRSIFEGLTHSMLVTATTRQEDNLSQQISFHSHIVDVTIMPPCPEQPRGGRAARTLPTADIAAPAFGWYPGRTVQSH